MKVQQFYLGCLAHASYLIVDEKTKTAAVIDPQRDVAGYLERAEQLGVTIRHVLLTHFHADFVAGHLELQRRLGAKIYLGERGEAEYDCEYLGDGDAVEFGDVRLVALETPGHTPESVSYVLYDRGSQQPELPHAVFTGDTLFIGDVGRPDLLASIGWTAAQLGEMLYDSLHDKLLRLPDSTLVYPAHGAGSMCGKNLSTDTVSTIGKERRFNYALAPMAKGEFVKTVTADQPQAPKYFVHDAILNRKERPTLEDAMAKSLTSLSVPEALRLVEGGAQLLDTRDDQQFARGTWKGAINVPLSGSFATWSGALLDLEKSVIVIADPGREEEAITRLGRIGVDQVSGFLAGGFAAVAKERPDLVQTGTQITLDELRAQLASDEPPLVLDVRTPGEWSGGHIEGALHIPLIQLQERLAELPRDRQIAVICRTSNRSASGISLLQRAGYTKVEQVLGGMSKWQEAQAAAGH